MAKRIEYCQMRAGDVKTGFGNPRKISKAKMEELERSLQENGDFGIFLIDENDNVIGGNQRLKAILKIWGPDTMLDCKRLIGYSKSQLKAINIKDNTHAGEWDLDALADWQADLHLDLGLEMKELAPEERAIPEMELIHYEKYNFVLICCRNELDYNDLIRKLGLEGKKIKIAKTRKIAARAVWYENIAPQIIEKEEQPNE